MLERIDYFGNIQEGENMKKSLLAVFISVLVNVGYSQWVQVGTVPTTQLNAVKFFDYYTGIAVGVGGAWRSTNSGVNWTQVLAVSGISLNAVSFSGLAGLAAGDSGRVYYSSDGGITWTQRTSGYSSNLYGTWAVSGTNLYAVGYAGLILHSTSAGLSWINQTNSMWPYDLYGIMMVNPTTGFAVGSQNYETFMDTDNGGTYWGNSLFQPGNSLKAIFYLNMYSIFAVGTNGRIRRSTNIGYTWSFPASGTTQQLNDIRFADQTTGYISGNGGIILGSTNGGLNWQSQTTGTLLNLMGLSLLNNSTGWAVGGNGIVIAQGIPTSINQHEKQLPLEVYLYQNYPNPFNPVTNIEFEIPHIMHVQIKIFDDLGKEADVLADNDFQPGVHKVSWDASKFGSGIYLYRLYAGDLPGKSYSITRKMLLIR